MRSTLVAVVLSTLLVPAAHAWDLQIWNEFARFTPDGQLIEQDWTGEPPGPLNVVTRPNRIQTLRNGFVSLVLLVADEKGGPYKLTVSQKDGTPVELDLYRAWYHRSSEAPEPLPGKPARPWLQFVPDALVPVSNSVEMQLPAADNRIPDQKAQMYWLDVFIPEDAERGQVTLRVALNTDGYNTEAYVVMDVLPKNYPDEDPITADHNSYGASFLGQQYPQLREKVGDGWGVSDEMFALMREYYKLHYEHRGTFHNLGYGHTGAVTDIYAPELGGYGESRRPVDWDLFERHFGPLLDGSAFADTWRGARPVEFLYLTINPEWPARYVLFGTQGYETEFVNAVREMVRYFEDKGWTETKFEMFFNHKKRYKGFEWDGDETRWMKDDIYFKLYKRLLAQSMPRNTPVQILFRHDASWRMHEQWQTLNGVVDLWICGGGILSWFPWAPEMLHDRGEIVWFYGGTPTAWEPVMSILEYPVRAWMWNVDGYCRWLTTGVGDDPWFDFNGGGTGMVYSGERFGKAEPIPSIRLKLERNAVQDLCLLEIAETKLGSEEVHKSLAAMIDTTVEDWWNPTPEWIHAPAMNWSNATLGDGMRPSVFERRKVDPNWWLAVRRSATEIAISNFDKAHSHDHLYTGQGPAQPGTSGDSGDGDHEGHHH